EISGVVRINARHINKARFFLLRVNFFKKKIIREVQLAIYR
ncbi:MAG: hypothetical protein ACI9XC_001327, partial [Gammaproteobacteria bacterium]